MRIVVVVIAALGLACGIPALDPSKVDHVQLYTQGAQPNTGKFCALGPPVSIMVDAVMKDGSKRRNYASERTEKVNVEEELSLRANMGKVKLKEATMIFESPGEYTPFLDKDALIEVTMTKNPAVKATLTLTPDFGCAGEVGFFAGNGGDGDIGPTGQMDPNNINGGPGGHAGDGGQGEDAPDIDVFVGIVDTPKRGKLVMAKAVSRVDGSEDIRLFEPKGGLVTVIARGGRGGNGGQGGAGGNGENAGYGTFERKCNGGSGGNGGDGGNGAAGGNGGAITIHYDEQHPELARLFKFDASGGAGGQAGAAGPGGVAGSANGDTQRCGTNAAAGTPGYNGRDGQRAGTNGRAGSTAQIVAMADPLGQNVSFVEKTVVKAPKPTANDPAGKPTGNNPGGQAGTLATADKYWASIAGPVPVKLINKTSIPFCEVIGLNNGKVPVSQNLLPKQLAPGASVDLGKVAANKGFTIALMSCDKKLHGNTLVAAEKGPVEVPIFEEATVRKKNFAYTPGKGATMKIAVVTP